MKKRIVSLFITLTMLVSMVVSASAKIGDVIGVALNTDIVAYINNYAIPSYAVNGTSCVVAEDLRNFGFDVIWDNATRSLSITRNTQTAVSEMNVSKTAAPSTKFADILETDIVVYAGGLRITSYAMNGYTMIPLEELTMLGECYWVAEERALKLWVDGVGIRQVKQPVSAYVAPGSVYVAPSTSYTAPSTPSYSTPFDTFKNAIISKGTWSSKYGNYSIYEYSSDGQGILTAYKPEDDTISMLYSSADGDCSVMLQFEHYENPVAILTMEISYGEVSLYGEYPASTKRFSVLMDDGFGPTQASAIKLINNTAKLFDLYVGQYAPGVTMYQLGVSY